MEFNFQIRFLGGVFNVSDNAWSRIFEERVRRMFDKLSPQKMERVAKLLAEEQVSNLANARTYFGTAVAPLKPSTIKRKGHSRPFIDKGILIQTPTYEKVNDILYRIYLKDLENRDRIGFWLWTGTDKMKARPFFGVGEYLISKVDRILEEQP